MMMKRETVVMKKRRIQPRKRKRREVNINL